MLKKDPRCTFVIVSSIIAVLFQKYAAILAVPTIVALALPLRVVRHPALSVTGTGIRASLHRAVFSVPSGDAQTRAVLALSVFVAARITLLQIA
jgi:hypothetical protein